MLPTAAFSCRQKLKRKPQTIRSRAYAVCAVVCLECSFCVQCLNTGSMWIQLARDTGMSVFSVLPTSWVRTWPFVRPCAIDQFHSRVSQLLAQERIMGLFNVNFIDCLEKLSISTVNNIVWILKVTNSTTFPCRESNKFTSSLFSLFSICFNIISYQRMSARWFILFRFMNQYISGHLVITLRAT